MTSYEAFKTYISLKKMMDVKNIPFRARVGIVNAKKSLEATAIAYEQSELDIAYKYGDTKDDGSIDAKDGFVAITNPENAQLAGKALLALRAETVDISTPQIAVEISNLEDTDISCEDIENLMPLITFI